MSRRSISFTFGILLVVVLVLAGCVAPAAEPVGGLEQAAVRAAGDTNLTNVVTSGDVTVGGDLMVSGECVGCGGGASYLTYVARLTQSGTGAPVATVLENTLGVTPEWTCDGVGIYGLVFGLEGASGPFTVGKTVCFLGQDNNGYQFECGSYYSYAVYLNSYRIVLDGSDIVGEATDGALLKFAFEVRVYP